MIVICIVVSGIVLSNDCYKLIKEFKNRRKIQENTIYDVKHDITEESI
jgi:hypothetical protein